MQHDHSFHFPLLLIVLPTLITGIYVLLWKSMTVKNKGAALISLLILITALIPWQGLLPIDYPMSMHMWGHMLILLIFPPVCWTAIPETTFLKAFSHPVLKKTLQLFSQPIVAYCTGMLVMWVVNIPMLIATNSHHMHSTHTFLFMDLPEHWGLPIILQLIAGLIYSLPVFAPVEALRLKPLQRVIYLFISCLGCTLLGILISLNPAHMYTLSTSSKGLPAIIDLQISGLIMWVPGCLIYISKSILILSEFFKDKKLAESY